MILCVINICVHWKVLKSWRHKSAYFLSVCTGISNFTLKYISRWIEGSVVQYVANFLIFLKKLHYYVHGILNNVIWHFRWLYFKVFQLYRNVEGVLVSFSSLCIHDRRSTAEYNMQDFFKSNLSKEVNGNTDANLHLHTTWSDVNKEIPVVHFHTILFPIFYNEVSVSILEMFYCMF